MRLPLVLFTAAVFLSSSSALGDPTPPTQPPSGPGGSDYAHSQAQYEYYEPTNRVEAFWIFEPLRPVPEAAPVVLLIHGWTMIPPQNYGDWIKHLVLRGNVVIYPIYQRLWTPSGQYTGNTVRALHFALEELERPGHVPVDLDKFAITGHSMGGMLTAQIADLAESEGFPTPRAIMPVTPGGMNLRPLENIDPDVLALVVEGEDDTVVSPDDAREIWYKLHYLPEENRDFVIFRTDRHGSPDLVADHMFPSATWRGDDVNALEWWGMWKLFDALCSAAFYGTYRGYALGNTPQQRYMGEWSDAVRVKVPIVTDNP